MERSEVMKLIRNGERWFNNGKKSNRYVVGFEGIFIHYKSKPGSRTTSAVWADNFAKWAKGSGLIENDLPKAIESTEPLSVAAAEK